MSDTDGKKTLGLSSGARPGNVKQSFSHGRTKNVVVETKRKRVVVPKPGAANKANAAAPLGVGSPSKRPAGISDAQMERRLKAVQAAKAREAEDQAAREADEKARAEDRERRRAEIDAKEAEEKARLESLKAKAEEEALKAKEAAAAAQAAAAPATTAAPAAARAAPNRNAPLPPATPRKNERDAQARPKTANDGRRGGKLTVNQALTGGAGRHRSMASMKRKQERARQKAMGGTVEREKVLRTVNLPEAIVVSELAARMTERVGDVVKSLMTMGMMVTQNETIDADTAELIIQEFGHTVNRVSDADVEDVINVVEEKDEDLKPRDRIDVNAA